MASPTIQGALKMVLERLSWCVTCPNQVKIVMKTFTMGHDTHSLMMRGINCRYIQQEDKKLVDSDENLHNRSRHTFIDGER